MSDYHDVLYDPRVHTHTSCVDEVTGCDAVVLIIGGRFGGKAVPQASTQIDFDSLQGRSKSPDFLNNVHDASVTQLEALCAVNQSIPIFTFVEERVWHDHATYEKNKTKDISEHIEYASIEKTSTAKYIFEFINFMRLRTQGNSITPFSRYQDIEEALKKQWSALLQRLLLEQRTKVIEAKRIDDLTEQFEDLKAAILSGVGGKNDRIIARGVVRFRTLFDFLSGMAIQSGHPMAIFITQSVSWKEFLEQFLIKKVFLIPRELIRELSLPRITGAFVKQDNTFYAVYFPIKVEAIESDFNAFMLLTEANRKIIFETLEESRPRMIGRYVRYVDDHFDDFLKPLLANGQSDIASEIEDGSDVTKSSENIDSYPKPEDKKKTRELKEKKSPPKKLAEKSSTNTSKGKQNTTASKSAQKR